MTAALVASMGTLILSKLFSMSGGHRSAGALLVGGVAGLVVAVAAALLGVP